MLHIIATRRANVFIYTEHTAREDLPNRPWNKVAHANSENTWHIHGSTFTVPYGTRMGACAARRDRDH